jgi:hypothetical protein
LIANSQLLEEEPDLSALFSRVTRGMRLLRIDMRMVILSEAKDL